MNNSPPDNGIPLLTEIIPVTPAPTPPSNGSPNPPEPAAFTPLDHSFNQHFASNLPPSITPHFKLDFNLNLAPDIAPPAAHAAPAYGYHELPAPQLQPQQLAQIRQEIQDSVTQTVLGHVDSVLHEHLQDQLAVVLDNLADILKVRVKASMEQALAASVAQAVAEEMAKFENSKK